VAKCPRAVRGPFSPVPFLRRSAPSIRTCFFSVFFSRGFFRRPRDQMSGSRPEMSDFAKHDFFCVFFQIPEFPERPLSADFFPGTPDFLEKCLKTRLKSTFSGLQLKTRLDRLQNPYFCAILHVPAKTGSKMSPNGPLLAPFCPFWPLFPK